MSQLIVWIKSHPLPLILLVIVLYLLWTIIGSSSSMNIAYPSPARLDMEYAGPLAGNALGVPTEKSVGVANPMMGRPQVPPSTQQNRMVVQDTSLSLHVNNVSETLRNIEQSASSFGGYMVSSHMNVPEGASTGSITVRVPSERRAEAMDKFRAFAVNVTSESVTGSDVTDQYVDNEARLTILNTTKQRFETILASANEVQDMLNVQRELMNIQQQIDQIKGQQQYLEQTSKLTLISAYLSTDELALPYAPDQAWRPAVVFKQAVRSLIGALRGVGSTAIWIGVYAPVWLPVVVILFLVRKRFR